MKRNRQCQNYKSLEENLYNNYTCGSFQVNCKNCIYFSSRNCGIRLNEINDFNLV